MMQSAVSSLLFGQDIDRQLNEISRLLEHAVGPDKAITLASLAAHAGIRSRRMAERIIETRLDDLPFAVVCGPRGYYRATDAGDINHYVASLRSRAIKCFLRARTVRRRHAAEGWPREGNRFIHSQVQLTIQGVAADDHAVRSDRQAAS